VHFQLANHPQPLVFDFSPNVPSPIDFDQSSMATTTTTEPKVSTYKDVNDLGQFIVIVSSFIERFLGQGIFGV
jgi:hypothetical protein